MSIFDVGKYRREIDLSNRFCSSVERNFNAELEHYKRELETIGAEYLSIAETVKQQFDILTALEKIHLEHEVPQKNFSENNRLINLSADVGTEKVIVGGGSATVIKGVGAGVGVGAGAVALMTAFSTAGTGAAISGLSGAAYVSSLLAALGGGTLASGGFGMVGGIFVLGGAIFLPALAVAGFFAHDKIKSAHRKALRRRRDAERLEAESKDYFAKLENCVRLLREINFAFRNSSEFFQRLLTFSFTTPDIARDEDYQKILRRAAQVTKIFGELKILNENKKPNENLSTEVATAKNFYEQCFEDFITFRAKMSPQVLKLTERLKNLKMISLKDEEIRAAFDEAVDSAKVELDVTAMKLNYKTEEYIPQFQKLLERNVTIKIFYGIGEEDSDENYQTRATAYKLKKIFRKYPNFKMKRADTHAKIFICDEKFLVLSSYNVLTKDGAKYTFGEAGLRSTDAELITHHRKEYFDF